MSFSRNTTARRRIRVFLDSNVLISGFFSEKGAPRILLDLLALGLPMLIGVTGRYNLVEVERNLKKKMPAALPVYRKYIDRLGLEIVPLPSPEAVEGLTGVIAEKDLPVLASAIACNADYLVAGDKKDFARLKRQKYRFTIVSPSEFVTSVLPKLVSLSENTGGQPLTRDE